MLKAVPCLGGFRVMTPQLYHRSLKCKINAILEAKLLGFKKRQKVDFKKKEICFGDRRVNITFKQFISPQNKTNIMQNEVRINLI